MRQYNNLPLKGRFIGAARQYLKERSYRLYKASNQDHYVITKYYSRVALLHFLRYRDGAIIRQDGIIIRVDSIDNFAPCDQLFKQQSDLDGILDAILQYLKKTADPLKDV